MAYRQRPEKWNDMDNSGLLFNTLRKDFKLKNETLLASWLQMTSSTLSCIRHGRSSVTANTMLLIYDKSRANGKPYSIEYIRELIASGVKPANGQIRQRIDYPRDMRKM